MMRWAVYYFVRDNRAWVKPKVRHYLPILVDARTKREALREVNELDAGETGYRLHVIPEKYIRAEWQTS